MPPLSRDTKGVIPIVPTPFEEDGSISPESIVSLVDYYERCGVDGLTILGVMGEAGKLTTEETDACVDGFLDTARARLPVIIGATSTSLAASVSLGLRSVERGAAGVMLQPMAGLKEDGEVVAYFESYIERTKGKVPVCVQDFPPSSNVHLSLAAWRRIASLEPVFMLKHEPFPSLRKLSAIRDAEKAGTVERVSILTSINAMHLPQELDRGADGVMVGVAYSDFIVKICRLHREGKREQAFDLYDALLPLIRHENQAQFGLAIRKEILRRRGALKTNVTRYPGTVLNAVDLTELDLLQARLERRLGELQMTPA